MYYASTNSFLDPVATGRYYRGDMDLGTNTVLVTGGASGIGYALAQRFLRAGSTVIICGRREDRLRAAQQAHPTLHIRVADLAKEAVRLAISTTLVQEFPRLNVLVNNAGIQRYVPLADDDWAGMRQEIAINFEAPVRLSTLLLPHLRAQPAPRASGSRRRVSS